MRLLPLCARGQVLDGNQDAASVDQLHEKFCCEIVKRVGLDPPHTPLPEEEVPLSPVPLIGKRTRAASSPGLDKVCVCAWVCVW